MIAFTVKVTPKARRNGITGKLLLPDGACALKINVTEAPEDGKANDAVIALLAKEFGTAKKSITITSGATSRLKRVEVNAENAIVEKKLEEFFSA